MHDTRQAVLETIKNQGQATVISLAEALGLSPISIRHHLTSLQAEGLVSVELSRQAVGRPRHVYLLTQAARRHFPNTYHVLAESLLDELKATLAPELVASFIERMAAHMAARYGSIHLLGTLEDRLRQLVDALGEEGFRAAVRHVGETTVLTEVDCPYVYVGQRHPEVCRIDHTLIELILGMDVQRTSCVLTGDRSCTFSIEKDDSTVAAKNPLTGSAS
jgi:predicted ArsR family transcriptional regulator